MRKYFHKLFGLSAMMRRAFAALLIMAIFANTVFAVTFTVNNNGDASDATPGNGICATSGAVCTLRAAIEEANALAGTDTINFSSGSLTLTPGSTMTISSNLTIDGSTAGMGNNIALNGQGSASFAALTLDGSSDGSTVKQLYIYGFNGASGRGISIQSGAGSNTLPVTIGSGTSGEGNVLGLQTDGTTVSANRIGIESAGTNIVFKNNVVSGSTLAGISLGNGSKDIILDRNCVGSNKDCNAAKANGGAGIEVAGSAVSLNGGDGGTEGLIIGETIALGNTVVGNNGAGIAIGDSTGSIAGTIKIQGNKIGEVASGAIGNGSHGIFVEKDASTANITIGVDGDGTNDSSEGNIIGGNTGDGIRVLEGSSVVIAGNQDGMYNSTAHGNTGAGITIGNSTDWPTTVTIGSNNDGTSDNDEKNSIGSNVAGGISIGNAVTATITGNYVGSDSSGNSLPNTGFGIKVSAPQLTTLNIGKGTSLSSAYSNNYVNYNAAGGNGAISIENTASGASAKIKATFIGVADNLFASAANSLTGLYLTAPANFTIGTEFDGSNDSYEGNFISNNVGNGIYIGNGVLSAIIAGNKIGVAAASAYSTTYTTAAGNGTGAATGSKNGIKVDSNSITSLTIGGVDSTQRNYIDSNLENGISLINMPAPALAYIYNNYIGLGSNGTTDLGNVNNGIYIAPTTAGVSINVGGTSTNQGNVISGNAGNGISLAGSLFLVLNIRQNIIGLVAAATSKVANDLAGISLQNNSATVNIGDGASTGRNVIGGNTSYGIGITGGDVGIEGNYFGLASDGTTAVADGNNEINAVSTSGSISALMIGHAGGENRFYDLARLAVFIKDIVPANETGSTYLETDNQWLSRINAVSSPMGMWQRFVGTTLTAFAPQACYDYVDNDHDGIADWGSGTHDLGCDNPQDSDESTENGAGGGGGGGSWSSSSSTTTAHETTTNTVTTTPTTTTTTSTPATTTHSTTPTRQDKIIEDVPLNPVDETVEPEQPQPEPELAQPEPEAEPVLTDTQRYIIRRKLDESVNVVSHNVLGLDRLNVDLIVNESLKTEVKTPNSSGTVPEVSRTPEQKVVAVNLDKLSQGQKLNVYEQKQVEDAVQKQVEKSMTEQLQQALVQPVVPTPGEISGGGSGGGGATIVPRAPVSIPITLANGRKIELKKVPKFKVTLDTKKAVDLQNIADANSEDVVVVTPSTVINDNNVSALLSVQNGGQIGDPLADEKIFFAGVAGLASKATKIEDLKPDVPKITNLVPGMRLAPKFMIGLAGPEAAEKLSVFAVDKGVSKDPNSWKVYKLEKYQLDEKFKNAVEVDLSGKMDAEVKNFTLVVQDENGKGSATDVILNKNIEMKLNDLTLQNEDQITVRGYAEPGSLVFVNWKSVLKTSTVIADASQGYFEVQVPKGLEKGDHTAYTYSYNPSKRMASSFAKVLFSKFF